MLAIAVVVIKTAYENHLSKAFILLDDLCRMGFFPSYYNKYPY